MFDNTEILANGMTLECYSDNVVKLTFFGDNIAKNVNNNHSYNVYMYKSQEDYDRDNRDAGISAQIYFDSGMGEIRAVGVVDAWGNQIYLPEKGNSTAYILNDGDCSIRLAYDGIKGMLSECMYYRVLDSNYNSDSQTVISVGSLKGAMSDKTYNPAPIPNQLVTGNADSSYFAPASDNYKIIEVTFEDYQFALAGWYQRFSSWVYGPTEEIFNEDVKLVYLLPFDDFDEPLDAKMKISYASENGQILRVNRAYMINFI